MVRQTEHGSKWEQSDYERAKEAVESLETDFLGPGSGYGSDNPTLEFDLGNMVECNRALERANWVKEALEMEGFEVDEVRFRVGYRGATNAALLLDVAFGGDVYR